MTLQEIRKHKGLTQKEAAGLLGVPLRTYKRYETNNEYQKSYKYEAAVLKLKEYSKQKKTVASKDKQKLLIVGAGFVGMACAEVYSKRFEVILVDIDENKVKEYENKFDIYNSISKAGSFDVALLCLPTDYDEQTGSYDCSAIENAVEEIVKINTNALVIVKSTVSVGYTNYLSEKFDQAIYFMPEFLREKYALEDAKKPTRLLIGADKITANLREFSRNIEKCLDIPVKTTFTSNKEAEAIKLFSNTYLAMRVSFFNELDNFALKENMNTKAIIDSLGLDQRIGDMYNDPSYCYSGYCLPKDVKVLANQTNSDFYKAIDSSNKRRKLFIVEEIIKKAKGINKQPTIGIYKQNLSRKKHTDSVSEIEAELSKYPVKVVVFTGNIEEFFNNCGVVLCEKITKEILPYREKIFIRSIK